MFLLVPAYPGCPGSKAVKRSLLLLAHKAAGRKTRLDIQNYGCSGNLLRGHGVVERNCISSFGRALKRRRKRNVVSRVSSVIVAIRQCQALACELNGHLTPCVHSEEAQSIGPVSVHLYVGRSVCPAWCPTSSSPSPFLTLPPLP